MRRIRLSEEEKADYLTGIATSLNNMRMLDSINMTYKPKDFDAPDDMVLDISPLAYLKMRTLVEDNTTECAWQGTVKVSEDRHKFTIKDILVYPQMVTGATVTTDDALYEAWHQERDNETYNSLRFQGHSHVNMAVSPSGVDKTLYNDTLQTLRDDSFYIFMITNKKGDVWVNIYDLAENAIYDKSDLTLTIGGVDLNEWSKEQKKQFKTTPIVTTHHAERPSNFDMPDHIPVQRNYKDLLEPNLYDELGKNIRNPYYASDNPAIVNSALLEQEAKTGKPAQNYSKGKPGRPAGSRNK